ncbi:phage protein [Yersinia massiliensis]|uniref:type V toxin-antitoxin system endoribonuclease antitoxin GhoS n=1 Tax=Yersinia massiliensis TaxID=419257 RepID=UPI0005DF95DE|nr:type V toxin-antitoxin system endoribonuclease antitoxin GhoS [Yersinia massiliensis]MCB5308925.1 type V toxin-antitoxin system endoribonuclease antitoxin GhoS [Yersinia massiliensis]CNH50935.1 phage protein [Yersinia massiliensis]
MAKFTVRVELRDSEDADYDDLHKKMETKGFSRTVIITESGVKKLLPSAEYSYKSDTKSTSDVGELAESIAEKVKKNPKIMVTKSAGHYYANFDLA